MALESVKPKREVYYLDSKGRPVTTRRTLKSDVSHDLEELQKKRPSLAKVAEDIVAGDPEFDIEKCGMLLTDTARVYVAKGEIVHLVEEFEVIANPDGSVRERRARRKLPQNLNSDIPLRWTGKFITKQEAVSKYVLTNKKQLVHINGLTFDFLFEMATELHKKDSLLLVRGGVKGDEPIVMNRGGKPYNAFLEGRIKGDSYCLILHLSNMELKKPLEVPDA